MSQQEFFPESQKTQQSWSVEQTRYRKQRGTQSGDIPKSEHPSTFEESIPPYSYRAQDQKLFEANEQEQQHKTTKANRSVNHDPREGYQSHRQWRWQSQQQSSQHQVPWWARPQPHEGQGIPKWLIALGIFFLALPLLPVVLSLLGIILTGVLIILLIPLLILGLLLVAGLVTIILMVAGVIPRRQRWWHW